MFKFQALKFLSVGLLLISSAAVAATGGSVVLTGSVTSTVALVVTPGGNTGLVLQGAAQRIVKVAGLAMTTNDDQGLLLTVTSGSMVKAGGEDIVFQVQTVVGGATAPLAVAFDVESGTDYEVGTTAAGPVNKDLYIMYTTVASQDPGAYEGTINLTVEDNT